MSSIVNPKTACTLKCVACKSEESPHTRAWKASEWVCSGCGAVSPKRPPVKVVAVKAAVTVEPSRPPLPAPSNGVIEVKREDGTPATQEELEAVLETTPEGGFGKVVLGCNRPDNAAVLSFLRMADYPAGPPPMVLKLDAMDDADRVIQLAEANVTLRSKVADLERQLEEKDDGDQANAGMLSDICVIAFEDEERALTHGYDGIIDRVRWLVTIALETD